MAAADPGAAPSLQLDLEGHGRGGETDLSGTVGWLTTVHPVRLDLTGVAPADTLRHVKERLRAAPDKGLGHGLLRHLNPQTASLLAAAPKSPVLFNYRGRTDRPGPGLDAWPLAPAAEREAVARGAGPDPEMAAGYPLEIDAAITTDPAGAPVLAVELSWPDALLTAARAEQLADAWFTALGTLTTPAALSLLPLKQPQLDRLQSKLRERRRR